MGSGILRSSWIYKIVLFKCNDSLLGLKKKFLTFHQNQILDRLCNTTKSPKSRLAGKLGLTKSTGLKKSERTTAEQVAKENLYGIKPLSIMGHKHELDQFDE